MTAPHRASQIWPVLLLAAKNRQILNYHLLADLIGVPRAGLGQLLEPIQSYCLLNELPPLLPGLLLYVKRYLRRGFPMLRKHSARKSSADDFP